MIRKVFVLAVAALLASEAGAQQQAVAGRGSVLGGDVLAIGERIFRLHGIDAMEFHQFCYVDGRPWACGAPAIRHLQTLVDIQPTRCRPTGESAGEAEYAVCDVGGLDLARDLIDMGLAVADRDQSMDYVASEEEARAGRVGIWQGTFAHPDAFEAMYGAVEDRLRERALPEFAAHFEERLLAGAAIPGFSRIRPATATLTVEPTEFVTPDLRRGFILEAVPPPNVFNWDAPAEAFEQWRAQIRFLLDSAAADTIWDQLKARAEREVDTIDAIAFFEALEAAAAPMIAAGRQPILLVNNSTEPEWIGNWMAGRDLPAGATVVRKTEGVGRFYLTTVNGVDIYGQGADAGETFLVPADMLVSVTYGIAADGGVVTAASEPIGLVFRYDQEIVWGDGPVTLIDYPWAPSPYEAGFEL